LVGISYRGGDHHTAGSDEVDRDVAVVAVDEELQLLNVHRLKAVVKGGIVKLGDLHVHNELEVDAGA
jgi:hypothetical protein